MKHTNAWLMAAALVVGAVLLTTVASTSASAVAGAPAFQDQQDRPPMPPPGGPGGMGPGGPGGPGGLEMLLFELDLTSAQSEKIKALQQESRTATRTYQDQIRKAEESIGAAVQADTLDEDAVRTQAAAIGSATTEMKVIQARTHAAIWKLLTADQQSQLKQRLAEWKPQGRRGR